MQLYEVTAGNDWPLIVVPEVVGRTVERTGGVVQVRYTQEKPQVTVEVDDDGDSPGPTKKLDLDLFFRDIPTDLVEPYREGIEEWEKIGGTIYFSNRMLYFEMELAGQNQRVVRCRKYQVDVIRRKAVEKWTGHSGLHDAYLEALEAAPVVLQHARSDKMWIKYDKLSASDLRVLLRAADSLVQQIPSKE